MILLTASQKATDIAFDTMKTAVEQSMPDASLSQKKLWLPETKSVAQNTSAKAPPKEKKAEKKKKGEMPSFVTFMK